MSFAFSAVSIGSIEWLYYSSLLLLRRWKDHLLPRKPLATRSPKALQSAASFATGCRCDGAVQSSGPSPNKNGNLPAYILPARRTCSGSAASRHRGEFARRTRGRAAAAAARPPRQRTLISWYKHIQQNIQAETGRYSEHWSVDTSTYSRTYRQRQADTVIYKQIWVSYQVICNCMSCWNTNCYIRSYGHVCSSVSASTYKQIQSNTSKFKKPLNSYLHVCACIWHSNTRHTGTYESLVELDIY